MTPDLPLRIPALWRVARAAARRWTAGPSCTAARLAARPCQQPTSTPSTTPLRGAPLSTLQPLRAELRAGPRCYGCRKLSHRS